MKIVITGAQSTGKSTLLNYIKKSELRDAKLKGFSFIDELTRQLKESGIVINENGNNLTQLLTVTTHIQNIVKPNFISDRCILDALVYTAWMHEEGKVDDWVLEFAKQSCRVILKEYSHIFYLRPEFDLVDDGVRSSNIQFRDKITDLFEEYITNYNIESKVIVLTGTVEERYKQFKESI